METILYASRFTAVLFIYIAIIGILMKVANRIGEQLRFGRTFTNLMLNKSKTNKY